MAFLLLCALIARISVRARPTCASRAARARPPELLGARRDRAALLAPKPAARLRRRRALLILIRGRESLPAVAHARRLRAQRPLDSRVRRAAEKRFFGRCRSRGRRTRPSSERFVHAGAPLQVCREREIRPDCSPDALTVGSQLPVRRPGRWRRLDGRPRIVFHKAVPARRRHCAGQGWEEGPNSCHSISSRRVGRGGAGFRRADAVRRRRFARPREQRL